jgi:hypothetical protein
MDDSALFVTNDLEDGDEPNENFRRNLYRKIEKLSKRKKREPRQGPPPDFRRARMRFA